MIEDEIEKFAMAGQVDTSGQETLVSKITQSVIHSKPYVVRVVFKKYFFGQKVKTVCWLIYLIVMQNFKKVYIDQHNNTATFEWSLQNDIYS